MQIIRNLFLEHFTGKTTLTVGNFDGVHLGHRHLMRHLVMDAEAHGWTPAVVTFQPHPRQVLQPGAQMRYISSWEERLALLEEIGIQLVAVVRFTQEVARMTADAFMAALQERLGMQALWVGPDFALGRERHGDVTYLRALGEREGFQVHRVPPFTLDGKMVHSSEIRHLVGEVGDVRAASRLLGRPFSVSGIVVHGDGRGRRIGVPTANLAVAPNRLIPANGVYATWAILNGERWPSATNVGVRPTVAQRNPIRTVESHLIGLQREIYYQFVRLEFVERLRAERRFNGLESLVAQIRQDVAQAASILATEACGGKEGGKSNCL